MKRPAALALLALAGAGAVAEDRAYRGLAYDLESGELVYSEHHREHLSPDGVRLETTYRDPDGAVFAWRVVRFHDRRLAPEFELVDERSRYVEGAEWQGEETRVYKREGGHAEEALVEAGRHPLVIDAGFDNLVVDNWDALQDGDLVRFDFLNADRLDRIAFRLMLTGRRKTADGAVSEFEMSLANPMLRWLVDSIRIRYLDADRSLYEYEGVSNIKDAHGDNYLVRIVFPRSSASDAGPGDGPQGAASAGDAR